MIQTTNTRKKNPHGKSLRLHRKRKEPHSSWYENWTASFRGTPSDRTMKGRLPKVVTARKQIYHFLNLARVADRRGISEVFEKREGGFMSFTM